MFRNTKGFFSFSVNDIQKAKEFYGKTLELEISEDKEMQVLDVKVAGGGRAIIYPKSNHTPASFTILNFPVPDLEVAMDELKKRGIRFEQYDLPNVKTDEKGIASGGDRGPRIAWFKDPFGNILSVLEEKR
jgi:catechol 2,3-dioxygenase-like lactoylglutathione lyase family enzyme